MSESILKKYAKKNNVDLKILRFGQMYGEGEERGYEKIISTFVRKIMNGERLTIFGDGTIKRSQLYVYDAVKYILGAAKDNSKWECVNVAAEKAICLNDIIRMIESCLGKKALISYIDKQDTEDVVYDMSYRNKIFPDIHETSYDEGINNYCKYYLRSH